VRTRVKYQQRICKLCCKQEGLPRALGHNATRHCSSNAQSSSENRACSKAAGTVLPESGVYCLLLRVCAPQKRCVCCVRSFFSHVLCVAAMCGHVVGVCVAMYALCALVKRSRCAHTLCDFRCVGSLCVARCAEFVMRVRACMYSYVCVYACVCMCLCM